MSLYVSVAPHRLERLVFPGADLVVLRTMMIDLNNVLYNHYLAIIEMCNP